MKHSFDLSNESNIHNGSEDAILMKEAGSSGIQQKINKTRVSTTIEINYDIAKKYSNNGIKQYNNEKKEKHHT